MPHHHARSTSFGYRFAIIHRIGAALVRGPLSEAGITTSQVPFLMELLLKERPLTQTELSEALVIDPAATARSLDQLEKGGYIQREVNPENRRQKLVSPTPKTRELEGLLIETLMGGSNTLVANFSDDEKELLLSLLDRIIESGRDAKKAVEER